MYLVAIAWAYVALMMAAAEAVSPQGSLFGAFVTLMLYGVLPLGLLVYILGTPGRKRRMASISISAGNSPPETTKSPMATSSSTQRSSRRWSIPSYRPASSTNPVASASAASSATRLCDNGVPAGER